MLPQGLCAAGRGDHYIEHGGYTWRTLDGADPEGTKKGAPNGGCQVIPGQASRKSNKSPSNYLPLPAGWVLAPNDATSIAVVAAHGWSTVCAVLAQGLGWGSPAARRLPGAARRCPIHPNARLDIATLANRYLAATPTASVYR